MLSDGADRITVAGRALRWVDDTGLRGSRASAPVISTDDADNIGAITARLNGLITLGSGTGTFVFDQFFFPFTAPRGGVFFLDPTSGVIETTFNGLTGLFPQSTRMALRGPRTVKNSSTKRQLGATPPARV